jgi:hypothetical protein
MDRGIVIGLVRHGDRVAGRNEGSKEWIDEREAQIFISGMQYDFGRIL